jgi:hypothetical protein
VPLRGLADPRASNQLCQQLFLSVGEIEQLPELHGRRLPVVSQINPSLIGLAGPVQSRDEMGATVATARSPVRLSVRRTVEPIPLPSNSSADVNMGSLSGSRMSFGMRSRRS